LTLLDSRLRGSEKSEIYRGYLNNYQFYEVQMKAHKSWVVLITGCSSGLGRAMAIEFAKQGHTVFATARRAEDIQDLASEKLTPLQLDVTNTASIAAILEKVKEHAGGVDLLVNNAGFGLMGPLLELPLKEVRLQFETNVFGPLTLVKAVAPYMVKQGCGRIVNVGSVSGVLTSPFAGPYCASKAALHSLSDAMRLEMAPFGIGVITLQPAKIASKFGDTAARLLRELVPPSSLYLSIFRFMEKRALASQSGATDATQIARKIVRAVTSKRPRRLIRLGKNSWIMPFFRWGFPLALTDCVLSRLFGLHLLRRQQNR
jgi:NAD(P)-dependent dehydrogenase (short-subunit alcohol dehydrogenase family)